VNWDEALIDWNGCPNIEFRLPGKKNLKIFF
jgi:hypothetical protein